MADILPDEDGGVTVIAENALTAEKMSQKVDMAVLATGMQPTQAIKMSQKVDMAVLATGMQPTQAIAPVAADLHTDDNGFILTEAARGMIAAGCAKKAADVVTCTQSSTAAALKAIQISRR